MAGRADCKYYVSSEVGGALLDAAGASGRPSSRFGELLSGAHAGHAAACLGGREEEAGLAGVPRGPRGLRDRSVLSFNTAGLRVPGRRERSQRGWRPVALLGWWSAPHAALPPALAAGLVEIAMWAATGGVTGGRESWRTRGDGRIWMKTTPADGCRTPCTQCISGGACMAHW